MERYRLKNIIILILALLNAFLLAALSIRGSGARTARRTQQQELVALFAADGMELDPALIPEDTAVSVYTLTRDEALEKKVAAYLLGKPRRGPHRAAAFTRTAPPGARRSSGTSAALTPPGRSLRAAPRISAGIFARNFPTPSRCLRWTIPAAGPPPPCGCGTAHLFSMALLPLPLTTEAL